VLVRRTYLGVAAGTLGADAALLLGVGAAMWSEPPTEAEAAVGQGLMAVGAALAIAAFVLACAWLNALGYGDRPAPRPAPSVRSDWEDA
jgi:hypothetical protein